MKSADTYAQTLVYTLFLVRLEGGQIRDLEAAWKAIPEDIPILRSAIEPLRVGDGFPGAISVWLTDVLHLLASTPDHVVSTIGHPSAGAPDPILYFYEHFLAAYDKVERIRRGVYYTPRPLVDYLVRAVHGSLKRDFGKGLGLASTDVQLLDPAVGTGTFLLAAAQTAVDKVVRPLSARARSGPSWRTTSSSISTVGVLHLSAVPLTASPGSPARQPIATVDRGARRLASAATRWTPGRSSWAAGPEPRMTRDSWR